MNLLTLNEIILIKMNITNCIFIGVKKILITEL